MTWARGGIAAAAAAAVVLGVALGGALGAGAPQDGAAAAGPPPPDARIGVVVSTRTDRVRKGSAERARLVVEELRAWGATPRVLGDAALGRRAALDGLDVLVLPYVACLTIPERQVVAGWVERGGGLLGLYFPGRDDERCRPLAGQGVGRNYLGRSHYGGTTEWADLSPAFSAEFLNDVKQASARVTPVAGHPVTRAMRRHLGGQPVGGFELRRPNGVWTELVRPVAGAKPLVVYTRVKAPQDARARRGAVLGWTNLLGEGRALYLGFNVMDHWHPFASTAFYTPAQSAANRLRATALLRAAVEWAAS